MRGSIPNNFAVTAQWLAVLAGVENDIVRCFHEGGGVAYEAFDRFHRCGRFDLRDDWVKDEVSDFLTVNVVDSEGNTVDSYQFKRH